MILLQTILQRAGKTKGINMFNKLVPRYKIEHDFLHNYSAFEVTPNQPDKLFPRIFSAKGYGHLITNFPLSLGYITSIKKIELPITIIEHAELAEYLRIKENLNK
ncbi:MAG: hypothetical protein A2499_15905 [Stygiobacter sp. RIFOXYC12_FULL_38_8]|nr:MAG: hypothetical protein A2X62_14850 [Stygiobacter sp. GWC2_38_9]OGV06255.1 MAG: hypothetical protein A2299_12540 [Stygiobacter sp. RIFOXYB2_FULL_37_11]OGV16006.1 MAG: hypothetical protein A2440_03470 [Stygiobacter sp. RIFOXYC2_FULL_38_25]OGV23799.1 MAG: hypothetical protein A2499_15905 [Stygiobacter sp. RIFOXYC12_FULL_38_8]OGV80483.1 MAG: hypothetical protein A2X65_04630 [Stygiobacter sp. GWF2_38_21]RJQ65044.1 MAG: hypothetical protein C4517_00385 [Stygiobacter sp.]